MYCGSRLHGLSHQKFLIRYLPVNKWQRFPVDFSFLFFSFFFFFFFLHYFSHSAKALQSSIITLRRKRFFIVAVLATAVTVMESTETSVVNVKLANTSGFVG